MTSPTITLAGNAYAIRPLTIRQLRTILPALGKGATVGTEEGVDLTLDIIQATLARDHSEVTRDMLLDMECTPTELRAAVTVAIEMTGLGSGDASPAAPTAEPAPEA